MNYLYTGMFHMNSHTQIELDDFSILEFVDFVSKTFKDRELDKYYKSFSDYFSTCEEKKVYPFMFYCANTDRKVRVSDFYKQFLEEKGLTNSRSFTFDEFVKNGYMDFLMELWKENLFEDRKKIDEILITALSSDSMNFKDARFFSSAVVEFIKDKEDYVQEILVDELILRFVTNSHWVVADLMRAYTNGNKYVKCIILEKLMRFEERIEWNFPDEIGAILYHTIEDYHRDDEELKHLIILLIGDFFSMFGNDGMNEVVEDMEAYVVNSINATDLDRERTQKIGAMIEEFKESFELRYGEFGKKAKRLKEEGERITEILRKEEEKKEK